MSLNRILHASDRPSQCAMALFCLESKLCTCVPLRTAWLPDWRAGDRGDRAMSRGLEAELSCFVLRFWLLTWLCQVLCFALASHDSLGHVQLGPDEPVWLRRCEGGAAPPDLRCVRSCVGMLVCASGESACCTCCMINTTTARDRAWPNTGHARVVVREKESSTLVVSQWAGRVPVRSLNSLDVEGTGDVAGCCRPKLPGPGA